MSFILHSMHIVIDARESGTSTGRYVDKLIAYLHSLQPKHTITLLAKPHRVSFLRHIAPNFVIFETAVQEFSLAEQFTLKRQIESLGADLVHFPMVQQPAFYRGRVVSGILDLTTLRFRNPAKNQLVMATKQKVYGWLIRRVVQKSACIITISNYVKHAIVEYCNAPLEKIIVTLPAADPLAAQGEPIGKLDAKPFLLYVGRPFPHKNLGRLMEAHQALLKDKPDLLLVLAGKKDANYARHEEFALRAGYKNIVFTGFVSDGQLRWLYEHCAAYVFPSLSEGFGLPGLEAMCHGAPVVSSNATCLPEIYGDAAAYFDPLNVADMTATIANVLDNTAKRSSLVQKGTEQVKKYSWQRMAEQTLAVYEETLEEHSYLRLGK